jgi:hypothetical protein
MSHKIKQSSHRIRRSLLRALFAFVSVAAILLGAQATALADTHGGTSTFQEVQQNTDYGYCRAEVYVYPNSYAQGLFYNDHAGWDCTMWLERSTNGGATWFVVSGYHTLRDLSTSADLDSTYEYWDGAGYLARACFHLNFAGAAKHCTYGI